MATLKQRLHRKNASGTYDTVHFESSSDLILRPSGRTVEQDLADYLPEVQANDNVPESLNKFVCGSTKAFAKRRALAFEGTVNTQINDLRDDLERKIAEVAAGGDVDLSDYYTKSETDNLLDDKSDIGHTHSQYVTSSTSSLYYYYTKTQVDQIESELRAAIDEAAAGGDVDLSNYYTKSQTDNLLNQKAALNHSHTISDITNLQTTLNGKANTSHTHSISNISGLSTELNELKTSVSEGKALVAAAVTDKGVQTAADATFQTIANNIGLISSGGKSMYAEFTISGEELEVITLDASELGGAIPNLFTIWIVNGDVYDAYNCIISTISANGSTWGIAKQRDGGGSFYTLDGFTVYYSNDNIRIRVPEGDTLGSTHWAEFTYGLYAAEIK